MDPMDDHEIDEILQTNRRLWNLTKNQMSKSIG